MRFHAEGTFVIDSWDDDPDPDAKPPPGAEDTEFELVQFTRTYHGDFAGSGRCLSVTTSSEPGSHGYLAIEAFEGTVQGRTGTCSIMHRRLDRLQEPWRHWTIENGKDGLAGIQGEGTIVMTDEEKSYSFEYDFDAPPPEPEREEPKPKKRRKRFWAP